MKLWLVLTIAFCLLSCDDTKNTNSSNVKETVKNTPYIKAAHYFSSAWPKTFWQEFEKSNVGAELDQIKADGFNTIILVLPWRGFEVGFDSDNTSSDARMYGRLKFLLQEITSRNLRFILRVGYPYN